MSDECEGRKEMHAGTERWQRIERGRDRRGVRESEGGWTDGRMDE